VLKQLDTSELTGANLEHFMPYLNELVETMNHEISAERILEALRANTISLAGWYAESPEGWKLGCYLIFELEITDAGRALLISGVVGDTFGDYEPFHEACIAAAKQNNCSKIKMKGRRGLWKMYRPLGYKETYTVYTYDILESEK